ncbi:Mu transposase C-terminal domain-containing protein [Oceanirhabdus sp. W0125-5]|uniref:Mu transposase C-terminal domain-containing protein n=1 Tax=Oceanirhabdus sp. W0125-5 TaxID=2999116 RepID=UPI0022F2F116|nr:Mu transposase C-terminal domain-containing protein [Oceanirhabdus sp. W0125-5]WBW98089.1 Mu transposase C-terminal domain-containing protein [Oceanirhabdus sp. W0125-5]
MELLRVNDVISNINDEFVERVLWLDRKFDFCYTIDMNSKNLKINNRCLSNFEEKIHIGENIILTQYKHEGIKMKHELSKSTEALLNKSWDAIKDIVSTKNEPQIYESKYRSELVKSIVCKKNISKATVYKYLKKYWRSGKLKMGLISNYDKCGGPGKDKILGDKKVGRPNYISAVEPEKVGININNDIKKIFKVAIKRYYENHREISLKKAYDLMLMDFFSIEDEETFEAKVIDAHKIPTYEQFKYFYYQKYRNIRIEKTKRKSKKDYELNYRELTSNSTQHSYGPGYRYQIDATISPFYLTNRLKTGGIGKPVVYFVIDVFSRMIVGVYVGGNYPCWEGAATALYNCTEDKVEFCSRYGLDISAEEWPNSTLPQYLLADRGELAGKLPEKIIENLGVVLENTPSYRADYKGIVERNFGVQEAKLKALLPGAIESDFRKRGGSDAREEVKMNLIEFTRSLLRTVIHHNNHLLTSYPLQKEMTEDDVLEIPSEIWNWGIRNITGNLRSIPDDYLKLNLMRTGICTVSSKEIRFCGVGYECNLARVEHWHVEARSKGTWKVRVVYDPRYLDTIYIVNQDTFEFESCTLKEEYSMFRNKSMEEIKSFIKEKKIRDLKLRDRENNNNLKLNMGLTKDVKEAEVAFNQAPNSIIDFRKDIKRNKKSEGIRSNKEQAFFIKNHFNDRKVDINSNIVEDTFSNIVEQIINIQNDEELI